MISEDKMLDNRSGAQINADTMCTLASYALYRALVGKFRGIQDKSGTYPIFLGLSREFRDSWQLCHNMVAL